MARLLVIAGLLACLLVLSNSASSNKGSDPSFKECQTHIDATIRNLAAKAVHAGEDLPTEDEVKDFVSTHEIEDEDEPEDVHEQMSIEAPLSKEESPPRQEERNERPVPAEPEVEKAPPPPPPTAEPEKPKEIKKEDVPEAVKKETPVSESKTKSMPSKAEKDQLGIFDKFVDVVFGLSKAPRDPKYATPWMTHPEFKREPKEQVKEKKKPVYTTGYIGRMINSFVDVIFGLPKTTRDPKFAEPWQTHKEFKKELKEEKAEKPNVPRPSRLQFIPNGFNKMVELVFGKVSTTRDPKYAQPWQTHKEHIKAPKEKSQAPAVKKKPWTLPGGGLMNSFVGLFFEIPTGTRDPKWAEPWQSHKEFVKAEKKVVESKPKVKGPGIFSQMVNKFVYSIFGKTEGPRDEKFKKPWQQHPEFQKRSAGDIEVKPKPKSKEPGFLSKGFNSFVELIFGKTSTTRDAKWAQPWQTHNPPKPKKGTKEPTTIEEPPVKTVHPSPAPKEEPSRSSSPPKQEPPKRAPSSPKEEPPKSIPPPKQEPQKRAQTPPRRERSHSPEPPRREKSPMEESKKPSAPKRESTPAPIERKEKPEAKDTFPSDTARVSQKQVEREPTPQPARRVADAPKAKEEQIMEEKVKESKPKIYDDEDEQIVLVPSAFRSRDHIESILGLDEISTLASERTEPIAGDALKDLKQIYDSAIKPLESIYKYQDISNRHLSDAEIFGRPLVLLMGPYSTGKSTFLNYLLGIEFTKRALKTGTPPSHGVFRVIQYGSQDRELDGTHLSGQEVFTSLQKYGQNFIDQLHGKALNVPLLKKVTFVEAPGILEMRRPGERLYPFNDVIQWFIDRADLILVTFDYTKLDAGYEMEAVLDQLKGREAQTRILLNKADQVPPEELIKVQGSLFWNLSPLLGVSAPPTVYAGSFASRPYRTSSPVKLFQAQEEALLHDIAKAINSKVDNRIAITRRHAVRVRNHAQMVDTYLQTFYRNKGFLTSKHKLAEDIVNNPHAYNIYEGVSLLTNISRYDLPDSDVYRDFFRVHNLYNFKTLRDTCTYIAGCPLEKIDAAISEKLPQLVVKYKRQVESVETTNPLPDSKRVNSPQSDARMAHVHSRTL